MGMSTLPTLVPYRAVLSLTGPDTIELLERLVTNTTSDWPTGEARYGALLTPQGKIIADFIALRTEDGVLMDAHESALEDFTRRLKLFRLRADVTIEPEPELGVFLDEDGVADPRSDALPLRRIGPCEAEATGDDTAYHAARIAASIPEFGFDFAGSEVFPADVNMDRLGGVDYSKGCFVGQEVVSRMYRRGKIRKRTVCVTGEGLEVGQSVTAGAAPIGEVTSAASGQGLVRLRTDRLAKARAADQPLMVGDSELALAAPDWLSDEIAAQLADG